ncbi:DUF4138 domain-containing protein [Subsaximicrobium wynnwilliamsii]|uniref:DUF4138 domain-containing protein n=1 Tax=Subsaximicrobium wynnwilliamsii TaxID=291179 RepID=A0A5C6ZDC0_9FLAO|nr:DUF4138 domain-containing protein [Subsaximicrobium wynnwilliamsii]TXD81513.1 DUF4138 domain-containing protein [Subsaximicrobium wynnwilliamsii]TXD87179.1 DUF4138 domain-containing protein [Subsaximicrobium wynnwilliamsii]TXE00873.1 DUF4138 domain-containing protein [Subsaximicrobium wynnwilliamsii]
MKHLILIPSILLLIIKANAQEQIALDTIYANDQNNVALFFPEPIRQGIVGSDNFVFTYNQENEQYFGLLQAKPSQESNLLVINKNGSIFSYIVMYKKQLSKLNYFISETGSIGNEKPMPPDSLNAVEPIEQIDNNRFHYQKFCSFLLDQRQGLTTVTKRDQKIILQLENIVFDKNELYFIVSITNKSNLAYDLNFLKFSIQTRQKGKKKSVQELYQEPLFVYNVPERIEANETTRLVYVMRKFSISNDRRAVLKLNEKNGERNLKLKISHRYINNPN